MRTSRSRRRLGVATAALVVLTSVPLLATDAWAGAPPSTTFTCVVKTANTCVVTIPVTSNMNEQVGSTMPDRAHPWFLNIAGGPPGDGGYSLTGPGNPDTYWDGKSGATQGYVWSAGLTSGTVSAGDEAVLTFRHVSAPPAKHYRGFAYRYTSSLPTGASVQVSAVVTPKPPTGHLYVQRLSGATWTNVVKCTYSTKTKQWTATFRWPYPKHTSRTFRLLATAAPGLLTTASASFRISTLS